MTLLLEKLKKSPGFQILLSLQQKLLVLSEENLSEILEIIQSYFSIRKTKSSFQSVFSLISYISECRPENIDLSCTIISNYFEELNKFFTKEQILKIFTNKKYQIFLFNNKIISKNDLETYYHNNQQIIKIFLDQTNNIDDNQLNFIIKNDDISKFQEIISKSNISLNSRISFSLYDSIKLNNNSKLPTLLEYSVAFSALKISKFILMNDNETDSVKAELYKDIGRYAIYGGNSEIIHLLEQNHLISDISSQKMFFLLDSISYHRNSIVDYIIENYDAKFIFDYFSNCLHSCNFQCFYDHLNDPLILNDINQLNVYKQSLLIFASQFGIFDVVECLLSIQSLDINNQDIYKVEYIFFLLIKQHFIIL